MIQRPNRRQPRKAAATPPSSLARQQADFTAEGSPPPGKVAGAGPAPRLAIKPAKPKSGT